jgi:adenylate cyclase
MVVIILGLSVALGLGWYWASSRTVRKLSGQLLHRIADHITDRTVTYMAPADTAAMLSRLLARSRVVRAGDVKQLERYFMDLLRVYPQLAMVNYGDEQGNFLMLKRFPKDTAVKGYPVAEGPPPGGGSGPSAGAGPSPPRPHLLELGGRYLFLPGRHLHGPIKQFVVKKGSMGTKIVRRSAATPVVVWKYRDLKEEVRTVSVSSKVVYDPRPRPWYRLALRTQTQAWTDVYLFFTDKMPGLGSAAPVRSAAGKLLGALAVEIELYKISDFLAGIKVGRTGKVFLVNAKRKVVAYPDSRKLRKKTVKDGKVKWVLRRVTELPDPEIRASFDVLTGKIPEFPPKRTRVFSFTHGGTVYRAMYVPFPPMAGKRWTVGIVVPEDDFLGAIKRSRYISVALTVGAFLIGVLLTFIIARGVSKPLSGLERETERISRLKLDGDVNVSSRLTEVANMVAAVRNMKSGLRSFEKYVPRELVRQLIASGKEARLEGQQRMLTVLFTDIAGFTSLAEGMEAEQLVGHLSEYLNLATRALKKHGATIDKYIGDAIMAFWGAPVDQPEHALMACKGAIAVNRLINDLNKRWKAQGQPPMPTRIGLHTGEVVVGNIGSEERLNYTIIGDPVNLASRIEGINKVYGTWICMSEETYGLVREQVTARVVDVVAVKGRKEGVRLYELRGLTEDAEEMEAAFQAMCNRAFELYLKRQWNAAIETWEQARALMLGVDRASEVMIDRCREYLEHPPPENWNGVYVARTK